MVYQSKAGTNSPQSSRPPGEKLDLSLLIARAIESNDIDNVYKLVPIMANIPTSTYLAYKAKLKEHFNRRLSITDFDTAVKDARKARQDKTPKSQEDDSELPQDAQKLCESSSGTLFYSESEGYLCQRGKRPYRVLLGVSVHFERYATGNDPDDPKAFLEVLVSRPGTDIVVATLSLSRPKAKDLKCWGNLEGKIIDVPGDEKESLLTYKAMSAHATREIMAGRLVNQIYVRSFGWHQHLGVWYNVRANGCISSDELYYDTLAPMAVNVPKGVAQVLPEKDSLALTAIDGGVLLNLLRFWREDDFNDLPLALLFACTRIMLPHIDHAGSVDWQLEMFGKTFFNKTTVINFFLTTFFGVYDHSTPTEITDSKAGDTGIGRVYKEARLHFVAYMDIDFNKKPISPLYAKYMDRRLESLGKTRNRAGGGERGKQRGDGSETRPSGGGLLIRTGESDPHEYSITECDDESTDAGACTFKFFEDSLLHKEARYYRSKYEIEPNIGHLRGLGIRWTQWLASLSPAQVIAQYQDYIRLAETLIDERSSIVEATDVHPRTYGYLTDMLAGAYFFLQFLLSTSDIEQSVDIHDYITHHLDTFVDDRLTAAQSLAIAYKEHRGGATQQDTLATRIGHILYEQLHEGHIHAVSKANIMPTYEDMPEGYSPDPHAGYSQIKANEDEYRAGGTEIGVITPDALYVSSKMFLTFLKKHIKPCPTQRQCMNALEGAGAVIPYEQAGRKYYTKQLDGKGPRYIEIQASLIYGDDEQGTSTEQRNESPQQDTEQDPSTEQYDEDELD